jgi:predicted pyridoxine 5'-phosphate oxidase superfamily flavin-nucleotide-binding protein
MELSPELREYIDRSVLCWLATASVGNEPNVSPKEIFTYFGTDKIIVANIASPQTIRNIMQNENVCLSFIDILVQKGFQVKGKAKIVKKSSIDFPEMESILFKMTGGHFPFASITAITVDRVKPILAPRYVFYPETTEVEQIENAKKAYGF